LYTECETSNMGYAFAEKLAILVVVCCIVIVQTMA